MTDFPSGDGVDYGRVAQGFIIVIGAVFVIALIGTWFHLLNERKDDCRSMGGTYVQTGRGGDPVCIKDGKIVIVWANGERVVNP